MMSVGAWIDWISCAEKPWKSLFAWTI